LCINKLRYNNVERVFIYVNKLKLRRLILHLGSIFPKHAAQPKAMRLEGVGAELGARFFCIIVIALSLSTLIFVLTTQTYCHIPNVPNVTKTGGNANERCTFPTQGFSQRGGSTRKFPGPSFRQLLKQTS